MDEAASRQYVQPTGASPAEAPQVRSPADVEPWKSGNAYSGEDVWILRSADASLK